MDFGTGKAIYLQITDYVCEQILSGHWPEGERVVSVRELAASLEVNPNTAMRAYNELADKQIIANKRGVGFFVLDGAADIIRHEHKTAFLHEELPLIFKKMHLLGITPEEVTQIYQSLEK